MNEFHVEIEDDSGWNCNDCCFQTNNESSLKKHRMEARKRLSEYREIQEKNNGSIECNNCGKNFDSKPSLMNHRKQYHFNIIKQCKYEIQN